MEKALVLIITLALLFSVAGCNDYYERDDDSPRKTRSTTSTTKYITLEEWYADVDLSQFSRHGRSTENDAMWVEKSDYTGTQYGCINTKGEWIVPLTSEIKSVSNFDFSDAGLSIVIMKGSQREEMGGIAEKYSDDFGVIYNTQGEVMEKFELEGVLSEWTHLNNGNIYLTQVRPFGTSNECCLMYCVNTRRFVEVASPAWQSLYKIKYSDGLMLVYSRSSDTPGTKYYDESGRCCIDLDNSNEYYREILYADHFVDGQANVEFTGMDGKIYAVKINKRGEWISEPEVVYSRRSFGDIF
ncbi:MAG: hypothetical protein IJB36_00650 [Clostridia bacterium]|nr:hypothetical protein [Clostridia bacterium]